MKFECIKEQKKMVVKFCHHMRTSLILTSKYATPRMEWSGVQLRGDWPLQPSGTAGGDAGGGRTGGLAGYGARLFLELPATTATGLATPGLHLAPGQSETRLAELKCYCGKFHYREGRRQRQFTRAVDRRAAELQGEYKEKADRANGRIVEEMEGRGRVRRRLDHFGAIIGIVAGLFNETLMDTLMLLDVMAKTRVEKLARATGLTAPQQEAEKGRVQGELRMLLSLSSLRASMACMLDRCNQIGDSAGLCTRRREVAVQVEEQMRRQREAQHLMRIRGSHNLRRGHIMLQ